jgi:hypothetical protein
MTLQSNMHKDRVKVSVSEVKIYFVQILVACLVTENRTTGCAARRIHGQHSYLNYRVFITFSDE